MDGVETFEAQESGWMDGARAEVVVVEEQVLQVSDGRQSVDCDALDVILLQVKQDDIAGQPERNHGQVVIGQIQIFHSVQVTDERRQDIFHQLQLRVEFLQDEEEESRAEERVGGKLWFFLVYSVMLT